MEEYSRPTDGGRLDLAAGPTPSYGWSPWSPAGTPPPPPPAPEPRRRMGPMRLAALVVATLIVGLAIGVPIGLLTRSSPSKPVSTSSPAPSANAATTARAKALYREVIAATSKSAGFHYVSDTTGGAGTQTFVGDAGVHGGTQVITLDSNYGTEQFTLVLSGGTVYFQGNVPALLDQLGLPDTGAPAMQGKWISVGSKDGPYSVIAPGITVGDQASELTLVPTSMLQITNGGAPAMRIGGTVPPQQGAPAGIGHLDVDSSSKLPISYVTVVTDNGVTITTTTMFSAFGTAPAPTVPTGAVAWSTLGASAPPGGYGSGGAATGATPAPSSAT